MNGFFLIVFTFMICTWTH